MPEKEKKKNKSPVEVTIERDTPPSQTHYEPNPVMIVRVGSHLIETTATFDATSVGAWIRSAIAELRLFRGGGPPIVSLCAFRGLPVGVSSWSLKGPLSNPNHLSNPYRAIAICLGGSRVLFYPINSWYCSKDPRSIKPLRDLLYNRKVVVVGWDIKEMAKKLDSEWGLKVARPVDVRKVAARAYGKDAVWWLNLKKGRVVVEDLGLEGLADLALDGMQLEKKPAKVREANWGEIGIHGAYDDEMEDMELIKYATRDAFVTHQIAIKCIAKSGLPPE